MIKQAQPCRSLRNALVPRIVALASLVPAAVLSFAYVAGSEAQSVDRPQRRFLTPADTSLFLPPDHPRVRRACRGNDSAAACPKFLKYGSDGAGPGPFPPSVQADVPHLLVTFTVRDIEHVAIAGGGVGNDSVTNRFYLDSSASHGETPNGFSAYGVWDFLPGTTEDFNVIMWQAIVYGGCVAPPPVIPISFRHELGASSTANGVNFTPDGEGVFAAVDNTSLVPTGFWNVRYTLRATNRDGDVSDFRVRGSMSLVCVGSDSDFP